MSRKVRFKGETYWFTGESLDEPGAFGYLHHFDEEGVPTLEWLADPQVPFAWWNPAHGLCREHEKIGARADIEVLTH